MATWFSKRSKLDSLDDQALVDLCNGTKGSAAEQAFNQLYQRHKDFVVRIALRYGADHSSALDILQDTFLYLLRKFPPQGPGLELTAKLRTLLYPVAKNLTLNQKRKRAPEQLMPTDDLDQIAPHWHDAPLAGRYLAPVLQGLAAHHQEVVLLKVIDELSLQEIAVALQVPLGTVKSRLHTALQKLHNSPDVKKLLDI